MDTDLVVQRADLFKSLFPATDIRYAVKANPAPPVLRALVSAGVGFDVASVAELELCLSCDAQPADIVFSNPIKKVSAIAAAHKLGVTHFTSDSISDVENLAQFAPRSEVSIRMVASGSGAVGPFGNKFGCGPAETVEAVLRAVEVGLRPGIAFHVGSQQNDIDAWRECIVAAAEVSRAVESSGVTIGRLNIGGGFPVSYDRACLELVDIARLVHTLVADLFTVRPQVMVEPGRYLVAPAGIVEAEVVLVSRRPAGTDLRWVFLDVGRYNGLPEVENEAIKYPLSLVRAHSAPTEEVILSGPTCDGDDILYQNARYRLPLDLGPGDRIRIHNTGAYTASYSSVGFNGIPPLQVICVGTHGDAGRPLMTTTGGEPTSDLFLPANGVEL
ncbi:type III PLP-dependent enzyme [Plantactinospora sp. WMMB782]|uniref:type III PLP-dependent enzyme n=1 Tax=Plantactinospora sp. WMMB782 TaxID=3404121 RepID=UPI003B963226